MIAARVRGISSWESEVPVDELTRRLHRIAQPSVLLDSPMKHLICLCAAAFVATIAAAQSPQPSTPPPTRPTISVDFATPIAPLDHDTWSMSGQDQNYTLKIFDLNAQNIGSVPHGGCRWFRPHDLLNLVDAEGLDTKHPKYDWAKLDRTLHVVLAADLKPFFEIMGNPSKHFTSFGDPQQVETWKRFVADLARHLEQEFGAEEVRSWFFESWNEPNLLAQNHYLWRTPAQHQAYYDASSEGLKAADPLLRFGGPGVSRVNMPWGDYLRSFFEHCDTGTNAITGEKGVRLDFISFHRKNVPADMVGVEVEAIDHILTEHPRFASLMMINDEADSEVGWNKPYPYRATPWYAAFIARSVNEHLRRIADGASIVGGRKIDIRLSNDDAFWGGWDDRTQCALFERDGRYAQIKKPSHLARTALALLGDQRTAVSGFALNDPYGAIATRRGATQVAVLLYHYSDEYAAAGPGQVTLQLDHLPFTAGKLAVYRIDADHADSHRAWQAMGSPAQPTDEQLATLRAAQELSASEVADVHGDSVTRTLDLPLPGVAVVVISADSANTADKISNVYAEAYPSLSGKATDVMIKWTSTSWFTKTFEVLHSAALEGPWTRVNPRDQLETGFLYEGTPRPGGLIKIRAIDYWDRVSGESAALAL